MRKILSPSPKSQERLFGERPRRQANNDSGGDTSGAGSGLLLSLKNSDVVTAEDSGGENIPPPPPAATDGPLLLAIARERNNALPSLANVRGGGDGGVSASVDGGGGTVGWLFFVNWKIFLIPSNLDF